MKDCREHFKKQILQDINNSIVGKATSYTVTDNKIFIPFNKNGKIKNIKASYNIAKKKIDDINSKYISKKYGDLVSLDTSLEDGTGINIHVPNNLIEAYAKKYEQENNESRQQQIEDARRTGLTSEEFDDNYLFDYLPTSQNGYNYGLYLNNKIKMRGYFSQRLKVLEELSNKTKKDLEQIEEFKEINRKLSKDIKNLENETGILDNFFNYFNKDLDIIEDILVENPTLDNLLSGRNFIDMMKFVYDFDDQSPLKTEDEKEVFSDTFYEELSENNRKYFEDFQARLNKIDKRLEKKEMEFTTQQINSILNNPNSNEIEKKEAKDLSNKIKDISQLSALFLPIDGDPNSTPIQNFVRKTYDDAVAKEETFNQRQELNNIKPKLEKKLKDLGYTNDTGFLGKLFSPVKYDIFKRKTKSGKNRLVSKYSEDWTKLENSVKTKFKAIEKLSFKNNKDIQDFTKIKQKRKQLFDSLKDNVNFIDVTRIPELKSDNDLQGNFGSFFKDDAENLKYKEELIQSLIGQSGNRKIAEKLYNKIIKEQKQKIYSFEISVEQYKNRLFKSNGVDSIDQLPLKDRNKILNKYYLESPFAFSESVRNTGNSEVVKIFYDEKGNKKEITEPSTLQYSSYLPNQRKFFDSEFESKIETDETLYNAWELFDDSLGYINKNRKYQKSDKLDEFEDSITYEYHMLKQHSDSVSGMTKYFSKEALNRFKNVISTSKFVDTKKDLKIQGGIISLDEAILNRTKPLIAAIKSAGLSEDMFYKTKDLKPKIKEFLISEYNQELPSQFFLKELIDNIAEKKVLNEQNLDLIDTLTSQLESVQLFKAKKEIENKLLFAKNQIEKIKKTSDAGQKDNAIKQVRSFITRHLYDVNNRPNWMSYKQNENSFTTVFNSHEKEMIEEIDKAINFIKESTKGGESAQANADIKELENLKNSKGRAVTTGSVFETMAIRLNILVGLGLNVPSQIGNYFMGNVAGRQNDGLEWSEGNFVKATSYTRKWKIAKRKLSKKDMKKYKLTNTLIDSLGVFQNSANELDRIKESAYYNNTLKFISNPLHIVGEVEKTIQRPQILSILGDVEIEDAKGNRVFAFNKDNTDNPHPAFELDDKGNLKLKSEFDTEKNRNTWINRNSQEYVDLFGESGIVPITIAKINGDYRATSTTQVKETSVGSLFMMFKTWLPAYVMRRYGKKDGVISNLVEGGRGSETAALTSMTAMMYGGIGAGVLLSPMFSIALSAAYLGYNQHKKIIGQEGIYALNLLKEIQKTFFSLQFATNAVKLGVATGAKVAQQGSDMIFGKRFITDNMINQIAGLKQKKGESESEFDKNKARLQFLLTEASTTLSLLALKVLVNATMFPDEEEEKTFKNEKGLKKYVNQPDIAAYYLLENMLTRFGNDVNLVNDPISAGKSVLHGSTGDFYAKYEGLLKAVIDQYNEGDYTRGPNAGKNRILTNVKKIAVPRGLTDFTLGFSKTSSKDFNIKDPINRIFMSDIDRIEGERQKQRTERKLELIEQYEKTRPYWKKEKREKKIQKILRKEFKPVKKYFNKDGSLKVGKNHKIERYQ